MGFTTRGPYLEVAPGPKEGKGVPRLDAVGRRGRRALALVAEVDQRAHAERVERRPVLRAEMVERPCAWTNATKSGSHQVWW